MRLPNEALFTPDCPDFRQADLPAGEAGIRRYSYSTASELPSMQLALYVQENKVDANVAP